VSEFPSEVQPESAGGNPVEADVTVVSDSSSGFGAAPWGDVLGPEEPVEDRAALVPAGTEAPEGSTWAVLDMATVQRFRFIEDAEAHVAEVAAHNGPALAVVRLPA